ncbi:fibrocystin-L-like isoform X2 [Penaeus chinensis]|uniref:fibrocystin-L-like isoform X2 n=1 Tax=Penaeus chinensis TaxID=139456 RepID=UPI001FB7EE2F|nr:fibrocystin-L-like isoform X2 [Penaeus chinensis]
MATEEEGLGSGDVSELFGADLESSSDFWRSVTGTHTASFEENMARGAWRVAGSTRVKGGERTSRIKRQAREEVHSLMCKIILLSDTSIVCDTSHVAAGHYEVSVGVESVGNALTHEDAALVTFVPLVDSLTPEQGSVHGESLLTITGAGFSPGEVAVAVGGVACPLESHSETSLTCRTPAHSEGLTDVVVTSAGMDARAASRYAYTVAKTPVLRRVKLQKRTLRVDGEGLSPSGDAPEVLVGGVTCPVNSYDNNYITCQYPQIGGGSHLVQVRDPVYGSSNSDLKITFDLVVTDISPEQGSFGGAEVTVRGRGFDPEGGTDVNICGQKCDVTSSTFTAITCMTPSNVQGGDEEECDVVVRNPPFAGTPSEATLPKGFVMRAALTPFVSAVSPRRGGTAGGTRVTVVGTGFGDSGNTVIIGGASCLVAEENVTSITCVTEALPGGGTFPVHVSVPGLGLAKVAEGSHYSYVDLWSSRFTWGGEAVPSEGQLVVVEKGHTVYLDQSTEVLKMLLIKGGHLLVDPEATSEVVLRAEYILVVDGGALSIGSEEDPFEGRATIELHGNARSIQLPVFGAKVLAVRNGTLDLHGAPVSVPWTRLASPAAPGDRVLRLETPVAWRPGDSLVLASTERRFSTNENEQLTIASVSGDGLTVTVTEPLRHHHVALRQTLGGRVVDTRAEVGLLSRNVRIRGVMSADFAGDVIEPCGGKWSPGQFSTAPCFNGNFGAELGSDMFGATVMLAPERPGEEIVAARIQHVEISQAGQAYQIGRYPLHFHMLGRVHRSYVRGCSVHHTYNRAITVHATSGLTVGSNVLFNTFGHAIFTEDGNEEDNVFEYNLAVFTRLSSSLLTADLTPASFWIVNPNNLVRHNAAAGGTHFGFWYRLESSPSGPSAGSDHCPNKAPVAGFYNNSAHSMGRYGLWVFSNDGYFPKTDKCGHEDTVARWENFTAWRCERGAEVGTGGALQFHNFVVLDNEKAGLEMIQVKGGFGMDDGPGVFNSLVVGRSALSPGDCKRPSSGVVAPEEHVLTVAGTTFVNFAGGQCVALSGCSQCTNIRAGSSVRVEGLTFINSPNKIRFKWEHETIWQDVDGSLSGSPDNVVVADMGILPPRRCRRKEPAFSVNPTVPGAVCRSPMKFLQIQIDGQTIQPPSLRTRDFIVSNRHGQTRIPLTDTRLSRPFWTATVYAGDTYLWEFDYASQLTNLSYRATSSLIGPDDYFFVEHHFPQNMNFFRTTNEERKMDDDLPDVTSSRHGDYHWDSDSHTVTYIVKGPLPGEVGSEFYLHDRGVSRIIDFKAQRCHFENCVPPPPPSIPPNRPESRQLWSDIETWREMPVGFGGHPIADVYNLPEENDDIIIPKGMTLIVDITTPPLRRVVVYGTLEFKDTMDHVFQAEVIVIQGGSVIAGSSLENPFTHKLHIILRSSMNTSSDLPMGVSRKSIGVYGRLSLHGRPHTNTWTKLGATAAPGDSQLTLAHPVDSSWQGKQVMVTSTSEEANHTEIRTVTHVNGAVLTLDSPLTHQHLGERHTATDGNLEYDLKGEVGLLTRNIVIEGEVVASEKHFGGSVRVAELMADGVVYRGQAQLSGVEWKHMGQEGFTGQQDPRFSLVFLGLGSRGASSYVRQCSFNTNYNTAVGIFASSGVTVEGCVVYQTVGSSIKDQGRGNIFRNNLVSVMLFPGTYDGRWEPQNRDWHAGFDLEEASGTVLHGNVVAGSEQVGFRVYGELCEYESTWRGNEAHNVIFGVMLWRPGREGPPEECRRVRGFSVWRAQDTAFYMQHYASLVLQEVISVDSQVGVNQLVYGPPALSHRHYPKTATARDSVFVGASPSHSCQVQASRSAVYEFFAGVLWSSGAVGGHAGVLFASFISKANCELSGVVGGAFSCLFVCLFV